jgi:hypothetical protein
MKYKKIKDIKVGDMVMSYNTKKHIKEPAKVTETFIHKDVKGLKIIINDTFIATPNHPVYLNNQYKRADKAQIGDYIINNLGDIVKVKKIERKQDTFDVYNIEVEGNHNYFAGDILNHNKCGEYEGDDSLVSSQLKILRDMSDDLVTSLSQVGSTFYSEAEKLIGTSASDVAIEDYSYKAAPSEIDAPSAEWDPEAWDADAMLAAGEDISVDMTFASDWGKTQSGGGTTKYAQALSDFNIAKATAVGNLGGAASDYSTAMETYTKAAESMNREIQNAEEAFELATKEIGVSMSQSGEKIAEDQETVASDVESLESKTGFAASGKAMKIKEDAREAAGDAWSKIGETAGLELEKTTEAYTDIVGSEIDDPDTDIDETVGSAAFTFEEAGITAKGKLDDYNKALGDYAIAMNTAKIDLETAMGGISTDLSTVRDAAQNAILAEQKSFKDATSDIYATLGGEDAEHYAPTQEEIISVGMKFMGEYLGLSDSGGDWDYLDDNSEAWNWRKTSSTTETTESGVTTRKGDTGNFYEEGDNFFEALWGFGRGWGIGECLHGDVKVLMGGR